MEKVLSVYIMASTTRVLYVGVTGNLWRRVREHKTGAEPGFTKKYHVHRLVYSEKVYGPLAAIAREKEIKGWRREKKVALIAEANPGWQDLSEGWYVEEDLQPTPTMEGIAAGDPSGSRP
jgi:putative endonuclease